MEEDLIHCSFFSCEGDFRIYDYFQKGDFCLCFFSGLPLFEGGIFGRGSFVSNFPGEEGGILICCLP